MRTPSHEEKVALSCQTLAQHGLAKGSLQVDTLGLGFRFG